MPPILEAIKSDDRRPHQDSWTCLVGSGLDWGRSEHTGWRIGHRESNPKRPPRVSHALSIAPDLEAEFETLADRWETETAFESVVTRKAMHPAYQRIIGLGPTVVPLILRRLAREPSQWYWALSAITGEDPAADAHDTASAAQAWQDWGMQRGMLIE